MLLDGIDVHCLAGLTKAWCRELPTGVLDFLSSEQVTQSQSEENYYNLVKFLPSTETSLLDSAINLMADTDQQEHLNDMNSHNITMVSPPNMTQKADPLMYAVQLTNFFKTLIQKAQRETEDSVVQPCHISDFDYSDDKSHHLPSQLLFKCNSTESVSEEDSQSDSTSIEPFEDCESRTLVNSIINGEERKVITGNKVCLQDLVRISWITKKIEA